MRFMDFCYHLDAQLDDSGTNAFIIRISNDVSFTITFKSVIQLRPEMFKFQPNKHIGIHPLTSIVQHYIRLGKIQREYRGRDIVETILTIIRRDKFNYDRFANQNLIVRLVFKGPLKESFFEIFNWFMSVPIPRPRSQHVKQLSKIHTPGDAVAFIMYKLDIPMWTMAQEMVVLRYVINSHVPCDMINEFLNLPLGHKIGEPDLAKCREFLITLRSQLDSSLDEYLASFESSPCGIHILSEIGLSHTDLGMESSSLNMDLTGSVNPEFSSGPGVCGVFSHGINVTTSMTTSTVEHSGYAYF